MKPNYTLLNKLNDQSKDFKVKVKVIQKGEPRQTPPKRRYQKLLLKDDEGTTMDGTIFGDDIEMFEQAIVKNGEYEFSNVVVRSVPEPFRARFGNYQINFNGGVRIKPLDLSACSSEPQYRTLDKIPHSQTSADELIDLVGVVLYVSELRTIKRDEVEDKVRDIIIADQSLPRHMKISAWNRFAEHDAPFFQSWPDGFAVGGFCGIQPITYRGISLITTLSTAYVEKPTGGVADAVHTWVKENKRMLEDWRGKAILLNNESSDKTPIPLAAMGKKKANSIFGFRQQSLHWNKRKSIVTQDVTSLEKVSLISSVQNLFVAVVMLKMLLQ